MLAVAVVAKRPTSLKSRAEEKDKGKFKAYRLVQQFLWGSWLLPTDRQTDRQIILHVKQQAAQ